MVLKCDCVSACVLSVPAGTVCASVTRCQCLCHVHTPVGGVCVCTVARPLQGAWAGPLEVPGVQPRLPGAERTLSAAQAPVPAGRQADRAGLACVSVPVARLRLDLALLASSQSLRPHWEAGGLDSWGL